MGRRLEPVDLMVAVGVFATILGIQMFFMAANGQIVGSAPETEQTTHPIAVAEAMEWLQPALGQSIVENALILRKGFEETRASAFELVQALRDAQYSASADAGVVDRIVDSARAIDAEHAGHVQYAMGKLIVNETSRAVRGGFLSMDDGYNNRIVRNARAMALRMDTDFQNHREANMGRAIVTASHMQWEAQARGQARLGNAIVHVVRLEDVYGGAMRAAEEQVGALVAAAVRTQALLDRMTQLASIEPIISEPVASYTEPRTLPNIPGSVLVAGYAVVILTFFVGLMISSRREKVAAVAEAEAEATRAYRKTG